MKKYFFVSLLALSACSPLKKETVNPKLSSINLPMDVSSFIKSINACSDLSEHQYMNKRYLHKKNFNPINYINAELPSIKFTSSEQVELYCEKINTDKSGYVYSNLFTIIYNKEKKYKTLKLQQQN